MVFCKCKNGYSSSGNSSYNNNCNNDCNDCNNSYNGTNYGYNNDGECCDICRNPIFGTPSNISLMAPVVYDEVGINLCATFSIGTVTATTYPTATSASISVLDIAYSYETGNVAIDAIPGRPNCYRITLANLLTTFALNLYDSNCRLVGTVYPTNSYLPPATDTTSDPQTNPTSAELDIFAPYGPTYDTSGTTPTPVLNYIGLNSDNNRVASGINLYAIPKLLTIDFTSNTATVGLTVIIQSVYHSGYRLETLGRLETPKACMNVGDGSNCLKFVQGDLQNLAVKPLDVGAPCFQESHKQSCNNCLCGSTAINNPVQITT